MIFKKKIKSYKDKNENLTIDENFSVLIFITKLINELEYFVFFGTLLGLVRENNLIQNDDDIDIYINIKERDKLIKILVENNIVVDLNLKVNQDNSFLQVQKEINNKNAIIDFYFFDETLDDLYLVEKWNFEGGTNNPSKHLRIPKIFTHPIQKVEKRSCHINFPAQPEYLCEFLYGKNWKKKLKLKKDEEYVIEVFEGKPVMFQIKKTIFGKKKIII